MKYEAILQLNENNENFFNLKLGLKNKKFVLRKFKEKIKNEDKIYKLGDNERLKDCLFFDIQKYTKSLIPNSFALEVNFTLTAPYFSKDDDEFYIIQNPCLKEKVFKVPMVRGSSIKGALLSAARDIIENSNTSDKIKHLESCFRIFGVGNDEFRNIVEKVDDNSLKLFFMLNGLAIDVRDDVKKIFAKYKEKKAQKGRAVFYPIYFDCLSLELINPHNRKTKAGTNPIHYEVVPKNTQGILQLIYIPFDGVIEKDEKINKEANQDLEFLKECIKKAFDNGIGAKTKLGWGRAEIKEMKEFWSER